MNAARLLALVLLVGCEGPPDVVASVPEDPGTRLDAAHPPASLGLSGDLLARDPTALEAGGRYYLFHTGTGILRKVSDDLLSWQATGSVFAQNPAWIADSVPDATELWAPDVAYFGNLYHLYYAASTFGSARSCIGHATTDSLAGGTFVDHGKVICSNTTSTEIDDWNAIDPSVFVTADSAVWLAFGSFDSGIKLLRLDSNGNANGAPMIALAARPDGANAIQAAALTARGGYYYLFTSFDACCRGVDSTHRLMVGRSVSITGPYRDRDGRNLLDGGGSLVLAGDTRFRGPGSNAVLFHAGRAFNVYHAYDVSNAGEATLRIAELVWDDAGWPVSGGP